jgi:type VI secretion system secreted protein Hcp
MKIQRFILSALLLCATTLLVRADTIGFLLIDGVEGEATDPAHAGEIEIRAYSFGGSDPGPGKLDVSELTLVKGVDSSSIALVQAVVNGTVYDKVVFSVLQQDKKGRDRYLVYVLSDVLISSYQFTDDGNGSPIETITLSFSKGTVHGHSGTGN